MSYSNTFLWDKCNLKSTRARVYNLLILSRVPTFLPSSTDILPQWPPVYAHKIGLLVSELSTNCMASVEHVSTTPNNEKGDTEILVTYSDQTSKQSLITAPSVPDGKISREHPGPCSAHTQLAVCEDSRSGTHSNILILLNRSELNSITRTMAKNNENFRSRFIRINPWIFRSFYKAKCKLWFITDLYSVWWR